MFELLRQTFPIQQSVSRWWIDMNIYNVTIQTYISLNVRFENFPQSITTRTEDGSDSHATTITGMSMQINQSKESCRWSPPLVNKHTVNLINCKWFNWARVRLISNVRFPKPRPEVEGKLNLLYNSIRRMFHLLNLFSKQTHPLTNTPTLCPASAIGQLFDHHSTRKSSPLEAGLRS